MRSRLLRSALLSAAVAVLLVGLPGIAVAAFVVSQHAQEGVDQQSNGVLVMVQARPGESMAQLRAEVQSSLEGQGAAGQVHVRVITPRGRMELGTEPVGAVLSSSRSDGSNDVMVEVPQAVVQGIVSRLALALLGLSAIALCVALLIAVLQARRLVHPLLVLADNADRLGRGESRLRPVRSGITELDRVAAGLARSAESMAAALAAERDFASDASHQLRTPLTALSMRLEEIGTSEDLGEVREEARIALNQVERLTQVVDSLLARSRRTRRTTIAPIDLKLVLDQQIEEWAPAFRERRRRLVLQPLESVRVIATPGALSQVLATLVENSLQHGRGVARITARRTGRSVVVEVTDDGPGIPANLGSRVFERTVSSSGSTGLGLALARDLAEADGGRLELLRASPPVFALFLNAPE